MFNTTIDFNQDLSGWCVSEINLPEPTNFANNNPTAFGTDTSLRPQWGQTCTGGSKIINIPIGIENNPFNND